MTTKKPSMIIHLAGSSQCLDEDILYLRKIIDTIHKHEHVVALNWVEPARLKMKRDPEEYDTDWASVLEDNLAAIARADIVIVEATRYGFSQGYQTAIALQQKKPVLMVSRDSRAQRRMAAGIRDQLFSLKVYKNTKELEKYIDKFIQENVLTSKDLRFNFFIDNEIYNHLRWASFKTGKTKSEIIRELVQKEISKADF